MELQQEYILAVLIEVSSIFTIIPFLFKLNQKYIHFIPKRYKIIILSKSTQKSQINTREGDTGRQTVKTKQILITEIVIVIKL